MAKRNPHDPPMPLVGDELPAGRALQDLTAHLIEAASRKIEPFGG